MRITFKDCVVKKRIFYFKSSKHLIKPEPEEAVSDLSTAEKEFSESGFKWATVKAYYSMFHSARALLYSRGYREKGHFCLYLAIKELFVKENKLDSSLVEAFNTGMILREEADYKRTFSEKSASAIIKSAGKFLKAAKAILKA
ncbi:MAG: HEPN domain-containing protein [Candidatus Omnitrophica bacterium]|nr:HEPN domain-containing protein [Candidatus Omnitrophota bacterium]MBU4487921.1 HEPN domain-containing protein [Candidatus Omnitrophota bacterium]MCG2705628.1 HEPN domain-containing protein [Candidatus Omnitrophota bacterium]